MTSLIDKELEEIIDELPNSRLKVRQLFLKSDSFTNYSQLKKFVSQIAEFHLKEIEDIQKVKKWMEPLTTFSMDMKPLYEEIPRGLIHEYGIPHGASDALIYFSNLNKFSITTRQDDNKLDSLGGHKSSGLTFFENMVKEILEELYSIDLDNLCVNEQKEYIVDNHLAKEISKGLSFCNTTINENVINGQQNIHVSQLFIFEINQELFDLRVLDDKSLTRVEWYSLEEIQDKMKTDEVRNGFKIVWNNFIMSNQYKNIINY